ncbi:hypothetical protein 019DV002_66 [Bacillus phage 019DV002]|uniref:Uncharacterized protein n=1 Tax=Bacillus phage 019DV002 TaxID=2601653 RepID=A0A5J6T5B0_9CAUD|nr:hypothetical protein 019DV002_66 [Bacillus phage 019DV002]QFG05293.1 hypothetical protein 019DV004_66 [Bacillus phage 019DV004]
MEKVKLTKSQAETLEAQIAKAADYLCDGDMKVISEFLIRMKLAPNSKDYPYWFGGEFKEIEFPYSFVTYVDALRVGYEVELTLEDKLMKYFDEEYNFTLDQRESSHEFSTQEYWRGRSVSISDMKRKVQRYLEKKAQEEKLNV